MNTVKAGVEAALRYTAFFNFPLTNEEVWRWLVYSKPVSQKRVDQALFENELPRPLGRLVIKKLTPSRQYKAKTSQKKLAKAMQVARRLALIPTVKLVALTGSAAIGNSTAGDDLDLMIVTSSDSLWLTRPLIVLLTELFFKRRRPRQHARLGDAVCLNLWLDESGLAVPKTKRNLYTAHEVLQLVPLVNKQGSYEKFLLANRWVAKYLANAFAEKRYQYQLANPTPTRPSIWSVANKVAFWLQWRYMQPRLTRESVGLHIAYFHPRDWQGPLQAHFRKPLGRPAR